MVEAKATARYVRTSAQKAGLVLELIRGKDVNRALATLKFARKAIAEDIAKCLRSAHRPAVYVARPPVCRFAHRLPMPRTKSASSIVALP